MVPRPLALPLALLLGCARADEARGGEAEALKAATEELATARAALEAERVAAAKERAELRKQVDELDAKLAKLELDRAVGPVPGPVVVDPLPMSVEPSTPSDEALAGVVLCDSAYRCKVERSYLEGLIDAPMKMAREARIVPSKRDGESQGIKIYGIRPGSVYRAVGIQNGDLLKSVNGHVLDSLEHIVEAAEKVGKLDFITFEIERRGAPHVLTLEIVDEVSDPPETPPPAAP